MVDALIEEIDKWEVEERESGAPVLQYRHGSSPSYRPTASRVNGSGLKSGFSSMSRNQYSPSSWPSAFLSVEPTCNHVSLSK